MQVIKTKSKKFKLLYLLKANKFTVLFLLLTVLGLCLGSYYINKVNLGTVKKLDILFLSDFDNRTTKHIFYTFISSMSSNFFFWISIFLSSLSAFGCLAIPVILIFRCIGLGLTAGYLYLIYGFKGIAFYVLVLFPGVVISCVCFIFMCVYSWEFSLKVTKIFLPHPPENLLWKSIIIYLKKSGEILVLLSLSSFIDTCFMKLFCKLFTF